MLNLSRLNIGNMERHDRIREAVEASGKKKKEIAKECGVSPPSISQWITGETKNIKPDNLFALSRATGYSAEWLATGRGEKLIRVDEAHRASSSSPTTEAAIRQRIDANAAEKDLTLVEAESDDWDKSEFVYLDKLDVRVQAGNGETGGVEVVQKRIPFMRSTLRAASVPPEAAKLVEFVGNSMEPYAFHGDTAGVNTLDRWPIKDGKVYAFRDCDLMRVKILERRPGGGLRIRSYNNEEYPPEDLTADEVKERIEIVGRVFWRSSVDY